LTFRPWRQSTTTAASFWEPKNPRSGFARGIYETPENAYLEEVHNTLVNRAQRRCDMKRLSVLTMVLGMMLFALGCPPAEKTRQPSLDPMPPADEAMPEEAVGEEAAPPAKEGKEAPPAPADQPAKEEAPKLVPPEQAPTPPADKPADKPAAAPADKPADKPAAARPTSQRTNRLPPRPTSQRTNPAPPRSQRTNRLTSRLTNRLPPRPTSRLTNRLPLRPTSRLTNRPPLRLTSPRTNPLTSQPNKPVVAPEGLPTSIDDHRKKGEANAVSLPLLSSALRGSQFAC
jgi:hypothetical protein